MDRPHGTAGQDHRRRGSPRRAGRAARAASVARRGAAARRRALLAGFLVVATVVGWTVVGLSPLVTWVAGAVPTVLLGSVLVLGRRAVLAGREADEAWEQQDRRRAPGGLRAAHGRDARGGRPPSRAPHPGRRSPHPRPPRSVGAGCTSSRRPDAPFVTGRAVHPSDASTEVFARIVEDKGESDGPARHASTGQVPVVRRPSPSQSDRPGTRPSDDEAWSPVPVPRPTYTMKATAPRREPAPLENLEGSTAARAADVGRPPTPSARRSRRPSRRPAASTSTRSWPSVAPPGSDRRRISRSTGRWC